MDSTDPTRTRHVNCPVCGAEIEILGDIGRKPLNIPVNNVYDSLRNTHSIRGSAEELGCSRGYIYGVLKRQGVTLDDILTKISEVKTVNAAK